MLVHLTLNNVMMGLYIIAYLFDIRQTAHHSTV